MARIGNDNSARNRLIGAAVILAGAIGGAVVVNEMPPPDPVVAMQGAAVFEGDFRDGFEGEGAGGGVPPIPEPPVDPGACPAPPGGFSEVRTEWPRLWAWGYPCGPRALCERTLNPYPRGHSYPAPIGANRGTYRTVPFTANAGQSVNLYFDQVQSRPQIGYNQRPAAGMFFTISPCPGDFEPIDNTSPNPYRHSRCRMFENSGSLVWTANAGTSACYTPPGVPLFLNIIPADPADGIQPGESSCENVGATASGCDVGAVTSAGV